MNDNYLKSSRNLKTCDCPKCLTENVEALKKEIALKESGYKVLFDSYCDMTVRFAKTISELRALKQNDFSAMVTGAQNRIDELVKELKDVNSLNEKLQQRESIDSLFSENVVLKNEIEEFKIIRDRLVKAIGEIRDIACENL